MRMAQQYFSIFRAQTDKASADYISPVVSRILCGTGPQAAKCGNHSSAQAGDFNIQFNRRAGSNCIFCEQFNA
jgi:hypothetical protein